MQPLSRPFLEEQTVLANRFQLIRTLSDDPESSWLAHDRVLDREVVVMALPARETRGRELAEEAGFGSAVTHAGLARVYDAAYESRPPRPRVAYVVREWIDGQRLKQVLQDGPLRPSQVIELATQVTEALAALHAKNTGHGRIHPGNVIVDKAGRAHLTDAGISAVRADVEVNEASDVRDVGALLYALTTARWPSTVTSQPARGLLPAPTNDKGVLSPRLVRAAVPRALDTLVTRVLEPGKRPEQAAILTAKNLLVALEQTADAIGREERDALPAEQKPPARWRKLVPYVAVLVGLTVLATSAYSAGKDVGEVKGDDANSLENFDQDVQQAAPGGPSYGPVDLTKGVGVSDFDPYGKPQAENSSAVINAYDRASSTAWTTSLYSTAKLGGLKPGVGLLVDLGKATPVTQVRVDVTPGSTMELRAANVVGANETGFDVVATAKDKSGRITLTPSAAVNRRYFLLWFTELSPQGSKFSSGIKEFAISRLR